MEDAKKKSNNMKDGAYTKPNKMEKVAPKIVKLLKGFTISDANIALKNAQDIVYQNNKIT